MDERSQHGHPLPQQAAPHGRDGFPVAPWPTYAAPQQGAPMAGHAPYPGPMTHAAPQPQAANPHQFQYAPQGYVMPGAREGQPAPMSAHGGTIGTPQQGAPMHAMPTLNGGPHQQLHQHGSGALAIDPHQQPQAWAFPTPQGMQLVQPGAAPQVMPGHAMQAPVQHQQFPQHQYGAPMAAVPAAALPMAAQAHPAARRRMRWETIVPIAAVACLIASIAFFISDFDRMTGRDAAAGTQQASTKQVDAGGDAGAASGGDAAEVVAQASALFEQGRFDDAANLLHPVLDVDSPDPAAVALHDKVDAAAKRNDALLMRLATQRRAKQWSGVVATIGQLEQLRPLSKDLATLRANARKATKAAAAMAQAQRYMAQGRYSQAMTVVERALKAGPNRQLQAMREQISARQAAPSTGGGGATSGRSTPPSAGGRPSGGSSTKARPPASMPSSSIPDVPKVPNPTGGTAGTGAGAVGGGAAGGASNCHTHEGVTSCHD